MMDECIVKQRLNIILLIDASKSMSGRRIAQVDQAIKDIQDYLKEMQKETLNVDFYISIIPFSTTANYYNDETMINIDRLKYDGIKTGGWSNLHFAYQKLGKLLNKESKGGIMPDFGGVAPIILLLSDGHPTGNQYKDELCKIEFSPWFKVALRYGIAIEQDDKRTSSVLHDFVGKNGDVIQCLDANKLKEIIKVIVITASKVKSSSSNVSYDNKESSTLLLQQNIAEALSEIDDEEW